MRASCSPVGIALLASAWACAASSSEPAWRKQVDAAAKPLIDRGAAAGLAIGLVDRDRTWTFGYGRAADGADKPPDERTIFEIGSVTKVFTAVALAQMVQEKQVTLDDPVGKYLPESVKVAEHDGRQITLEHLATHTSGLPRLPANLLPQIALNPGNPYAKYTVEQLYAAAGGASLASPPGSRFAYSNFGAGLLGHALARRAGMTYEELVREKICQPLGMTETWIVLPPECRGRFAQGHTASGKAATPWEIVTLAGAGGLRSTVHDMLLFVAANLGLRKTPLDAALEMTHVPRHETDTAAHRIALGWHLRTKEGILWHNGETGGFHSFVGIRTDRQTGVVVLSNTACKSVDELGFELLKLL
jgi:serine-type D-Ala-D-Ala carboxypeptidase/endopeptidase